MIYYLFDCTKRLKVVEAGQASVFYSVLSSLIQSSASSIELFLKSIVFFEVVYVFVSRAFSSLESGVYLLRNIYKVSLKEVHIFL